MNFSVIYEENNKTKSHKTSIELPEFQLNFTKNQYDNLLTIKNIFSLDSDEK
jgi:hypothetical protein